MKSISSLILLIISLNLFAENKVVPETEYEKDFKNKLQESVEFRKKAYEDGLIWVNDECQRHYMSPNYGKPCGIDDVEEWNKKWEAERNKEKEYREGQRKIKEEAEIRWEERNKLQRETETLNNVRKMKKQCKELGFKEGSKKFKDCVVELME